MNKPKKFIKQTISDDADKEMEQGAKTLRRGLGLAGALFLFIKNKDNLKTFAKSVGNVATKFIKKL